MTTITLVQANIILTPKYTDKVVRYRIEKYQEWLADNRTAWYSADLGDYRDYLLNDYSRANGGTGLATATVKAHLSSIRSQYQRLLESNSLRDMLYASVPEGSIADKKSAVDEILIRLSNMIKPRHSRVQVIQSQDIGDNQYIRLKATEARQWLNTMPTDTLRGLRDKALIQFALFTGLRESELCQLRVVDLYGKFGNEDAVHVRSGKGAKARYVPYGALISCRVVVEQWLQNVGITSGYVFRGFTSRHCTAVRETGLTERAVQKILKLYPVFYQGKNHHITPHDLRRSYAYQCYLEGMDIVAIRDNLGHADIRTTQVYIGEQDVSARLPKRAFD